MQLSGYICGYAPGLVSARAESVRASCLPPSWEGARSRLLTQPTSVSDLRWSFAEKILILKMRFWFCKQNFRNGAVNCQDPSYNDKDKDKSREHIWRIYKDQFWACFNKNFVPEVLFLEETQLGLKATTSEERLALAVRGHFPHHLWELG